MNDFQSKTALGELKEVFSKMNGVQRIATIRFARVYVKTGSRAAALKAANWILRKGGCPTVKLKELNRNWGGEQR